MLQGMMREHAIMLLQKFGFPAPNSFATPPPPPNVVNG
jgi:hypothetical protein